MTEATTKIMKMIHSADEKIKSLKGKEKKLEDNLKKEKAQLHRSEAMIGSIIADSDRSALPHMRETMSEKSQVMDYEHELSELKIKIADADKKMSDMKRWTSQSESQDEHKQSEALSYAKKSLQSI